MLQPGRQYPQLADEFCPPSRDGLSGKLQDHFEGSLRPELRRGVSPSVQCRGLGEPAGILDTKRARDESDQGWTELCISIPLLRSKSKMCAAAASGPLSH